MVLEYLEEAKKAGFSIVEIGGLYSIEEGGLYTLEEIERSILEFYPTIKDAILDL